MMLLSLTSFDRQLLQELAVVVHTHDSKEQPEFLDCERTQKVHTEESGSVLDLNETEPRSSQECAPPADISEEESRVALASSDDSLEGETSDDVLLLQDCSDDDDTEEFKTTILLAPQGPLQVPGRLRAQDPSAPPTLRFVPTPNAFKIREDIATLWQKPLQINPISTDLIHVNWADSSLKEQSS